MPGPKDFINLLTPEILEEEQATPFRRFLAYPALIAGAAAALLVMYGMLSVHVMRLGRQVTQLTADRDGLKGKIAALEGRVAQVGGPTVPEQAGALGNQVQWSEVLRVLSLLTPDGIRVISLSTEEGRTIRLVGIASSPAAAVGLLTSLERFGRFEARLVRATAQADHPGWVEFEITAALRPAQAPTVPGTAL